MNFSAHRREREDPTINITSLIDVVFLLLIFFMVSTTFVVAPGIKVNLPKTESKEMAREKQEMTIAITKDGRVFLEGHQLSLDALRRRFAERAAKSVEDLIIIQADESVPHGKVVAVMDLAKSTGFNRLAIATEAAE
ncbi:MAG: biopolymer transporter ExbD [Myxococcales bacterium]|nr:biopolymer transporter ExbD [Myxococcales bacterium]